MTHRMLVKLFRFALASLPQGHLSTSIDLTFFPAAETENPYAGCVFLKQNSRSLKPSRGEKWHVVVIFSVWLPTKVLDSHQDWTKSPDANRQRIFSRSHTLQQKDIEYVDTLLNFLNPCLFPRFCVSWQFAGFTPVSTIFKLDSPWPLPNSGLYFLDPCLFLTWHCFPRLVCRQKHSKHQK